MNRIIARTGVYRRKFAGTTPRVQPSSALEMPLESLPEPLPAL